MSKPDPPQPPNPYQTAAAQTGTNVGTGVANAFLNNVNQVTPQGNLSYDVTGNYSWTDPSTGSTYQIPRFTATQTQTPMARDIEAQNNASKLTLARTGATQAGKVEGILNTPFDPGSDITRSYGPEDNFSADRQRVEDAMMARLNPQLQKDRAGIEQRLADQGIRYGSQAY